ncbi:chloride channel protein [Streptomyces sp. HNM0663]|uniref:Chloride channel protein n=1 Tax=Streptomyces chengmaiensis TaxID=3040919 RepID=A0ABT6HXD4_9ACTN|nr:chloride channel protein [Streptomyces chengmaiensis]MDH2392509.1 chloride channel protein [Streptomyces chengmaiensis]
MTDPTQEEREEGADRLYEMLRSRGYLKALALCALIGVPVSLAAFWFLVGLHELEGVLWSDLPEALGYETPPWWWPLPLLTIAGAVVGVTAARLYGGGGHVPAEGLKVGGASHRALPGVVLAAFASLPFGAVLGPEAPLIALGGGLAVLAGRLARAPETPRSTALLGAAGSASAISAIFGNPLIGGVLLIEIAGVAGPQLVAVMLPALLSSGIGYLVFTGFGRWTGLNTGSLSLNLSSQAPRLDAGDVLWSFLLAVAIGAVVHGVFAVARPVAAFVSAQLPARSAACALAAGGCAALYTLITDRTPVEVASSGQATMSELAADPHAWSVGALVAVLAFKTAAYVLSLGALRGGPVFPALFLGAAAGVLCAPLPGLGVVPGMAAGMAATAAAVLRLPVSSSILVVLLLGSAEMIPVVILAAVTALVAVELLHAPRRAAKR